MKEKNLRKIIRENIKFLFENNNLILEKNNNIINYTKGYVNGTIEENEYFHFLNKEVVNEGIVSDVFDSINIKISLMLYSLVVEIGNNVKKYMSKIFSVVMWVMNKIQAFKEKHPVIFKIIIIICITLILLCISSVAHAQEISNHSVTLSPEELKQAKALQSFMQTHQVWVEKPLGNLDQANIKASGMPMTDTTGLRFIKEWLTDVCSDGKFNGDLIKDKRFVEKVNEIGIKMMENLSSDYAKEIKNQAVSDKFVDIGHKLSSLFKKQ
jgi:hypothetical protein